MKNRYVLAADIPLIALAAFGAFALRFDWFAAQYRTELIPFLLIVLLVKPVVFVAFGMYRHYWAYASVRDMLAVVLATSAASLAAAAAVTVGLLTHQLPEFSRSVLLIDWVLTLFAVGGLRLSIRVVFDARAIDRGSVLDPRRGKRVLIVGAGQAGAIVVREMQKNPRLGIIPAGFLDDDPAKRGKRIHGLPVLGGVAQLSDILASVQIDEVIIAMPKAPGATVRAIAEQCHALEVKSRIVPGVFELLDNKLSVSRLRHVEISDLLRRRTIEGDPEIIRYLQGRCVLITGAGGSIGLELCRQVAHAGPSMLVLLGHGENSIYEARGTLAAKFPTVRMMSVIADVRDGARIDRIFAGVRPSIVLHAAAHKHVPLMEENPEEAVTNNIIGTRNLVNASIQHGCERFVLISTDKAVAPSSIMGASKRVAEDIVRSAATRHGRAFVVVRFGNVLGSRGSVVPLFKQQIERGGPVTVTHPEMKRFFMTIPEAVDLVLQAGGLGNGGELFVLNMGAAVRIVDLATDLIKLSGFTESEVPIAFTGLRPGEKLEELLWEDGAIIEQTNHPDVLQVREPQALHDLATMVTALENAARRGDGAAISAMLADWARSVSPVSVDRIPTQGPQN